MHRLALVIAGASTLALAAPLSAQRADTSGNSIPDNQRPPAGMCRIWLNGVPAGQQPAPTDCATAIRHRPPNGRVVFGEPVETPKIERRANPQIDRKALPPIERFTPPTTEPRSHVDSSKRSKPPEPDRARPVHRDTSARMRPIARREMRIRHP